MKHTQGEWSVKHPNNSQIFISSEYHGAICQLPKEYGYGNTDEAEANAKLIAAAPDMLQALQGIMKVYESMGSLLDYDVNIVRRAIKKATT